MRYIYIFFAITLVLQPLSQMLEKKGMMEFGRISGFGQLMKMETYAKLISNPYIVVGVLLSIISLLFWLATLSNWNISYLYPLGSSLTQVVMVIGAIIFLGERLTLEKALGVASIAIGCVLLNWKS